MAVERVALDLDGLEEVCGQRLLVTGEDVDGEGPGALDSPLEAAVPLQGTTTRGGLKLVCVRKLTAAAASSPPDLLVTT